jgi:hypothetical protein
MAVESIGRHALNILSRKYFCRVEEYGLTRARGGGVVYTVYTTRDLDPMAVAARINRTSAAKHGAVARSVGRDVRVYDSSGQLDCLFRLKKESFAEWLRTRLSVDGYFSDESFAVRKLLVDDLTVGPVLHETLDMTLRAPLLVADDCVGILRRDPDGSMSVDLGEDFDEYATDKENLKILQFPFVNWFFDK